MSATLLNHHMVTHEQWGNFTETDHNTWKLLFERQSLLLQKRATKEIKLGLEELEICSNQIPKFSDLNNILKRKTGFTIVPVKEFIPEDLFFKFLSERKFPSTCFIRQPNQLYEQDCPSSRHMVQQKK